MSDHTDVKISSVPPIIQFVNDGIPEQLTAILIDTPLGGDNSSWIESLRDQYFPDRSVQLTSLTPDGTHAVFSFDRKQITHRAAKQLVRMALDKIDRDRQVTEAVKAAEDRIREQSRRFYQSIITDLRGHITRLMNPDSVDGDTTDTERPSDPIPTNTNVYPETPEAKPTTDTKVHPDSSGTFPTNRSVLDRKASPDDSTTEQPADLVKGFTLERGQKVTVTKTTTVTYEG